MLMELKISVDPEILEYVNLLNCCVFSLSYMQVAPSMVVTHRRLQSYLVPSFSSIVATGVCVCVEKHNGVCRRVPCFTVLGEIHAICSFWSSSSAGSLVVVHLLCFPGGFAFGVVCNCGMLHM
ncbi:unnamed protein product [Brassica oleracea]